MFSKIPDKINYYCLHLLLAGVPLLFYINLENPFTVVKWTFFRVILFIMITAWILKKINDEKICFLKINTFIPFTVFILFSCISYSITCIAGLGNIAAEPFWNIISMMVFFYVTFEYYLKNPFKDHLKTAFFVFFIVALYGICQHFGLDFFRWEQSSPNFESISTIGNSNLLGLFLNLSLPFTVIFGLSFPSGKMKVFSVFSAVSILLCLYFTYARGSIVTFFISLPFWVIFLKGEKTGIKLKTIAIVLTVILLFLIFFSVISKNFLLPEIAKFTDTSSIQVRIFLWKAALRIIRDNPLTGTGFNTYSYYYLPYRYDEPAVNRDRLAYAENSHNEFLDTAVSIGIPGFLSFIFFLFFLFRGGIRSLKNLSHEEKPVMKACLLSILLYLININTVFSEISSQLFFWYFSAIILAFEMKSLQVLPKEYNLKIFAKNSHLKTILTVFLIIFCFFFIWKSFYPLRAELYIYQGKTAREDGNFKEALNYISKALILEPYKWQYWVDMAKTFESALDGTSGEKDLLDNAIKSYNNAIELNPLHPYTYADLGRLYSTQSSVLGPEYMDKSIEEYEKAVALDPYNIIFYNDLGTTYLIKGDFDEAIRYYERSIEILPDSRAYSMLGKTLMNKGNLHMAEKVLNRAIELNSKGGEAYFLLAYLYLYEDKKAQAFTMADKAFYLEPYSPETGNLWLKLVRSPEKNK